MEEYSKKENIIIESYDDVDLEDSVLKDIVDIHMQTFTGFFLTFLGRGFLKYLYKGFIEHSKSGVIVAKENDRILGFLAFSEDLSDFYKNLIKTSLLPFAWYGFLGVLRKPKIFFRLVRSFLKPSESKREEKYIELSSIGVLPVAKHRHIGSIMITELKNRFNTSNNEYIKLETDAINNEAANRFYIYNGFKLNQEFVTHEGRVMNEYRWYPIKKDNN
ncbi:GNAT family N-acetyltransferase [Clostridium cadaveris]|uniref:GNAT family N-acetyltransferase n=1 Tax=Clostridium cadaveris TaxID=1529 RepID=UPI001E600AB9|nr:GNAT family N-acetyltransferase [Clostridium cadaveris]UFH65462.1 GNAT family N-acetyltransferase [Clostridium cadaveris]